MRKINKIIIHCTDSEFGNVRIIDNWHKARGWKGIGYHYLIGNAYPEYENYKERIPAVEHDGLILEGRPIDQIGAHTLHHNLDSIGIALVGTNTFTRAQLHSLVKLLKMLLKQFDLSIADVYGHYEFNSWKSCPNINMNFFREEFFDLGK